MELVVVFNKPYTFEGQEHKEVDLSGLENLTGADLVAAEKVFATSGNVAAVNELSIGYTSILASKASGKPVEFFEQLPAKEAVKVKNTVGAFLFEED
jgi:hypothetical protein